VTENATGSSADAEGAAGRGGSDDAIAFTPITVPDRARGRRRRRVLGTVAGVVVVAAGITVWAVAAGSGGGGPVRHTAVIPQAFGAYTRAEPAGSLWKSIGGDNLDFSKGDARVTYTAAGGEAAKVTVTLDPRIALTPDSSSDPALSEFTGSQVRTGPVTSHPAGAVGGSIACVDYAIEGSRGFTECVWQDKSAAVTLVPARDGHTVVSASAADDLRTFLAALRIERAKG
jgi:hypothetical protein